MTSPRLSAEQRRALTLLASIPHGIAEEWSNNGAAAVTPSVE
jgi:hypothetical protein